MRHQWEAVFLKGFCVFFSASTSNIARIEEMERLLKQAHAEKTRLLESRVGLIPLCQRPGMWWFKMPCLQASISSGTLEYSLYLSWPSFLFILFYFLATPSGFWEKEMATHLSVLAWKIPWTEEPGRLQSMGSQSPARLPAHRNGFWGLSSLTRTEPRPSKWKHRILPTGPIGKSHWLHFLF